ncbi:hypothetical protein HaLaN_21310, partial [Haematococcus lacustris]
MQRLSKDCAQCDSGQYKKAAFASLRSLTRRRQSLPTPSTVHKMGIGLAIRHILPRALARALSLLKVSQPGANNKIRVRGELQCSQNPAQETLATSRAC